MNLPSEIYTNLKRIESLATLPTIAAEILELMQNSKSNMKEIAKAIEKDASITAKIIKISNSPLWGCAGRIDNIQRALVLLGMKQVTNIVIAISLYSKFSKFKPNHIFDREKFWLHSAATAHLARFLSKKFGFPSHGEEFVASLIHDIGIIILDQFFDSEFLVILEESNNKNVPILEVEKNIIGCSHAEIGSFLLNHWNFPETISISVQNHHSPLNSDNYRELSAIVHIADLIANNLDLGYPGDSSGSLEPDNTVWTILTENNTNNNSIGMEELMEEVKTESMVASTLFDMFKVS